MRREKAPDPLCDGRQIATDGHESRCLTEGADLVRFEVCEYIGSALA